MLFNFLYKFKNNFIYLFFNKKRYEIIVNKLKSKKKINIIFLTNHISQWKYQILINMFNRNGKYITKVIFVPNDNYNKDYLTEFNFNKVEFKKINIELISSFNDKTNSWCDLNNSYKPDIIFFSRSLLKSKNKYSILNFTNSLNCYVPYSIFIDNNDKLQCATLFHKLLWKQFLPFKDNIEIAKKNYNANNVVVTDYPGCDLFKLKKNSKKIWKNPKNKKIIWAPHHTIDFINNRNYFSTFLNFFQYMIDLSIKYKDSIDFCFKPHPALKEKLYNHKEWGISKTNDYYKFWKNSENTLLSESGYQDLFIESDSLILDSVSFTAEYLYLNKPYCFLTKDNFDYNRSLNIIGKKIFEKINKVNNISSLEDFIKNSVLKRDKKQLINQKYILKNINVLNNKNLLASQNIYNVINKAIES